MGNTKWGFCVLLAAIIAASSLITAETASASVEIEPMSSPVITISPIITEPPTPTPSPTPEPNIFLDYDEASRTTDGADTKVTLSVSARYNFGDPVTYDFQHFTLQVLTERGGLSPPGMMMVTAYVGPAETGSVTVSNTSTRADFTLTFRFLTIQESFYGHSEFSTYELVYDPNATPIPPTPTPSPTPNPTPTPTLTPTENPTTTPSATPASPSLSYSQWSLVAIGIAVIAIEVCVGLIVYYRKRQR